MNLRMKNSILYLLLILFFFGLFSSVKSQTILDADGPGKTYELINSVLAPKNDAIEAPDCAHSDFGRHITETWDSELNRYVFEFHIHVTPDNDRCVKFDRQRNEIKTYEKSPAKLIGVPGESVIYKWMFKLPAGFQVSKDFTHLHQIKAVDGDDSDPIFCLTARKGTPNKLELSYYIDSDLNAEKLASINLSLFENTWVEVTEKIKIDNVNGTYSIVIKNVSSGKTILSYSNNKILTIRDDNTFIRPKWGIYRSLNNAQDLRDEIVRFSSFSIEEEATTYVADFQEIKSDFFIAQELNTGKATLNYSLEEQACVNIQIFNASGNRVRTLVNNQVQQSGNHQLNFDINTLPDGVYILNILTDQSQRTVKMLVKR